MKIPVNSIKIPQRYIALCEDWHNGINCMLYAIASTGGVTTGTNCTISMSDCDNADDQLRKWYYALWCDLSCDVGRARKQACLSHHADCDELMNFEDWVDMQVSRLEQSYRLEDWEW